MLTHFDLQTVANISRIFTYRGAIGIFFFFFFLMVTFVEREKTVQENYTDPHITRKKHQPKTNKTRTQTNYKDHTWEDSGHYKRQATSLQFLIIWSIEYPLKELLDNTQEAMENLRRILTVVI